MTTKDKSWLSNNIYIYIYINLNFLIRITHRILSDFQRNLKIKTRLKISPNYIIIIVKYNVT